MIADDPLSAECARELADSCGSPQGDLDDTQSLEEHPEMAVLQPADSRTVEDGERTRGNAVIRLASLSHLSYEQVREEEARSLSVRVSVLDDEVRKVREQKRQRGDQDLYPNIEPWPESVNYAALLEETFGLFRRFIVCDEHTAVAATVWCAFTWFIEHVEVAPIALITAPEMRCGKSLMLDLMSRISRQPLVASNVSPAAVFRLIEKASPTLFIDEADTFLKGNEQLRGVINSGHTRSSAFVIRTVGDDFEPRRFSTWGAKAISGIGKPPPTILDRSIILELRRKLPSEKVERLRRADAAQFQSLSRKMARFVQDFGRQVGRSQPMPPTLLNDRAQDNWEPLLAIAEAAGVPWPQRVASAAVALAQVSKEAGQSNDTQLLASVRRIFEAGGISKIRSSELIRELCSDDEIGWSTYDRGRPLSCRQLGAILKQYGIRSKNLAFGPFDRPKGYEISQFGDAFARYLDEPLSGLATAATSARGALPEVAATSLDRLAPKMKIPLPDVPHQHLLVARSGNADAHTSNVSEH